jgi:hypothetical protein
LFRLEIKKYYLFAYLAYCAVIKPGLQPVLTNPADRNGNWTCTLTNAPPVPARFYRAAGQ